jgi:hypothetical protein
MVLLEVLGGLIVVGVGFAFLFEHRKAAKTPFTKLNIK